MKTSVVNIINTYGQRTSPTLGDYIIAFLSMSRNVRRNENIWRELKRRREAVSKATINTTLTRLEKKGFTILLKDGWTLTKQGREELKKRKDWQPPPVNNKESLLVCFDIPETRKKNRDWLREQLKLFNYRMVQRSIWRGPGPLPPGFYAFLKDVGIFEMVHVFRLAPKQKVLR